MDNPTTKPCTGCSQNLSLDAFPRRKDGKNGLDARCRDCHRLIRARYSDSVRAWRENNKDSIRKKRNAWELANRDRVRATKNRYYERNRDRLREQAPEHTYRRDEYLQKSKEKLAARSAVQRAIRAGRLSRAKRMQCVVCGVSAAHYDHYLGYEKEHWLDVEPVCSRCHGKRIRERDEARKVE